VDVNWVRPFKGQTLYNIFMRRIHISPAALYMLTIIVMAILIVGVYLRLPPQIPLFYSLPLGAEQIADTWFIALVPLVALICITMNSIIYNHLLEKNDFTSQMVKVSNYAIIMGAFYIFIKIIFRVVW